MNFFLKKNYHLLINKKGYIQTKKRTKNNPTTTTTTTQHFVFIESLFIYIKLSVDSL